MIKLCSGVLGALFLFAAASGCSSTNGETDHDLGTQTVGAYSVHVIQEGTFLAANTTKYAIQPSPGKPDSVECWFGTANTTPHVTTVYDPADNDFDCTLTTPATAAATDKLFFSIITGGKGTTGSVAPQP